MSMTPDKEPMTKEGFTQVRIDELINSPALLQSIGNGFLTGL